MDRYSRERLAATCRSVLPAGRMVSIGAGYRRYQRNVAFRQKVEAGNAARALRLFGADPEAVARMEIALQHITRSLFVNPPGDGLR